MVSRSDSHIILSTHPAYGSRVQAIQRTNAEKVAHELKISNVRARVLPGG